MTLKEHIIGRGIVPFVGLIIAYYMAMTIIYHYFLSAPNPALGTLSKYIISLAFDALDITRFTFSLPTEYAQSIVDAGLNGPVVIASYHLFTDGIAYPYAYILFPYYLVVAAIISAIYCTRSWGAIPEIKRRKQDKYLRGIHRISAAEFCARARKSVHDSVSNLAVKDAGNLPISDTSFREHTLILGATGTGKSQLLISIVSDLMHNSTHPRAIFVDRKGEFYSLFGHRDRDVLINPYDARCAGWNPFNEVNFELNSSGEIDHVPPDLVAMADTILGVRSHKGEDLQWYSAAASVFCSAFCYCVINKIPTTRALCDFGRMALTDIIKALQTLPPGLRGGIGVLGTDASSKTASSIMSVYNSAIRQLDCFSGVDGDWSAREWMRNGSGNLYISTAGRNGDNYTSIVTTLIDLSAREIKGFPDDGSHRTRIVYVVDELAALPAMQELIFLLTQARSKGVAVVLANQTVAKVRHVYGDREAENIISNCKTKFLFMTPEATDAKYLSQTIGMAEVERTTMQRNESAGSLMSKGEDRKGKTWSKQIVQDAAFLPADITSLGKGQAIALLPNLLPDVALLQLCMAPAQRKRNKEFEPVQVAEIAAREVIITDTTTQDSADPDTDQGTADPVDPATGESHTQQEQQELYM